MNFNCSLTFAFTTFFRLKFIATAHGLQLLLNSASFMCFLLPSQCFADYFVEWVYILLVYDPKFFFYLCTGSCDTDCNRFNPIHTHTDTYGTRFIRLQLFWFV